MNPTRPDYSDRVLPPHNPSVVGSIPTGPIKKQVQKSAIWGTEVLRLFGVDPNKTFSTLTSALWRSRCALDSTGQRERPPPGRGASQRRSMKGGASVTQARRG
jgi:hypothetical protein